ncbi:MAG: cysteine--tRNA ligase [Bdellovibrionales bacterium]
MELHIYNSMKRQKQKFESITPGKVKMYVCGPTVYDLLHLGNFVGPIVFNMVRNWLEECGYEVSYVYNYTDVDDKIIAVANKEGVESSEVSERFIREFRKDFEALGLRDHSHNPRVTEHIQDILELVESLVEQGVAYVVNGEVLFSVDKFPDYGKLSGKKVDELRSGARVEIDNKKQNPVDFALWKPAKPGEPSWDSPWGKGRPGWHIECSAMSKAILGEQIDIHGGGKDLIFPHHENEIAQSEGCFGKEYVRYWMHNNFLNFGNEKMSKSLGNVKTARAFFEEYHPEIFKYMVLSTHYRTENNFSDEKIQLAVSSLARIYSCLVLVSEILSTDSVQDQALDPEFKSALEAADEKVAAALCDDFNTPEFMAEVFYLVRLMNSSYTKGQKVKPKIRARAKAFAEWMKKYSNITAIFGLEPVSFLKLLDDMLIRQKNIDVAQVEKLIEDRKTARQNKDWAKSDEVRDMLLEIGVEIQDTPSGTTWSVSK